MGLNYAYLCFDVSAEDLKTAVDGLRVLNVRGFNCTMPDKNRMCEIADRLSPAAQIIGAVNTVVNDQGVLTGYNTDGIGYMKSVKAAGFHIIGKKMTLLGAGGAATAIASQAALDGVSEINIFSRKTKFWDRAGRLADTLNSRTDCKVSLYELAIVSDVIYNPRETMLMKLARENGCHTFNGLYMLYYQGAEAFRLWTGMEMPEKEIKEKFFQP